FGTRSGCLCSFQVLPVRAGLSQFCGGNCERETPLPIPNRAVKPLSADGTWPSRARESRTPPVFLHEPPQRGGSLSSWAGPDPAPRALLVDGVDDLEDSGDGLVLDER